MGLRVSKVNILAPRWSAEIIVCSKGCRKIFFEIILLFCEIIKVRGSEKWVRGYQKLIFWLCGGPQESVLAPRDAVKYFLKLFCYFVK